MSYAQDGGIRGKVVSRNGRVALSNVQVKIESLGLTVMTDKDGNFVIENLPKGDYTLSFATPEFEPLDLMVRVDNRNVKDLRQVIIVPTGPAGGVLDDAIFAEFDNDSSSSDTQALPSSLSSSKDLFNNIASYRFSEMRFNVRGYDSQYSDIYLNGIRFNDAMTGYGPWSLWSGLNDATRNQENYTGLEAADFGIGGIGGMTNVNATRFADAQGLPGQRVERQPDVPFPGDGLLRFGTAGQRLVVCLLGGYPSGRQRLCGRRLLQLLFLLRFGREALRRQPPSGPYADGVAFESAGAAAGIDRRGLPPVRQQLLQSQRGLSGRQAPQLARAQHPRTDRDAELHVGHVGEHAHERRHGAALR